MSYLPQDYLDGGVMGCFVQVDGVTYVWDHNVVSHLDGLLTTEIGKVASCNNTVMPSGQLAACRIPVGTVLYKGRDAGYSKYDAIYYQLEGQQLYARLLPTEAYRSEERWWEEQTEYTGKPVLTADALRKLQEEKDKQLTRSDLKDYSFISFIDPENALEYWLFQVDSGYRLKLVLPCTDTKVEPLEARFYAADSPNHWIDLLTTDLSALYTGNFIITPTTGRKMVRRFNYEGFVTKECLDSGVPGCVTLELNYQDDTYLYSQLIITTPTRTIKQKITTPEEDGYSVDEFLYLADVDGDQVCEILLQEDLGGNGGYGAYLCRVFQITDNAVTEIFRSEPGEPDTGFYLELQDSFTIRIHNQITGDQWEIAADEHRKAYYFDQSGKLTADPKNHPLNVDSFYEFIPKDVDGDGIYEICTTQYTWDITHVDGVGNAKCVFKYNKASGSFQIIKTDFVQYTD